MMAPIEFSRILEVYEDFTGEVPSFLRDDTPSVVVNGNKVIGLNETRGVEIKLYHDRRPLEIDILVARNHNVFNPMYLCIGGIDVPETFVRIRLSCCEASRLKVMIVTLLNSDATISVSRELNLERGANLVCEDRYHIGHTKAMVKEDTTVNVEADAVYEASATLVRGMMERFEAFTFVNLYGQNSMAFETERIHVIAGNFEKSTRVHLKGTAARVNKDVAVLADGISVASYRAEMVADGADTRGEFKGRGYTLDDGKVGILPMLKANVPSCELHQDIRAGIFERENLQYLMAKGFTQDEAVNLILGGLFR